jgi:uncharacterized protein
MNADTIERVIRFVGRSIDRLRVIRLSWFGGEPLLALPVVEEISSYVCLLAARAADLVYKAEMTTNGYFLELSVAEHLQALGIDCYQVTLDGPQAAHDKLRVCSDGTGSFHRIWNNLSAIRASDLPVKMLLQVHLTPQNLADMPSFLKELRYTFLDDERFSVHLMPVGKFGGTNDDATQVLEPQELALVLPKLREVLCAGMHRDVFFRTPSVCYASRRNSLVVRANGSVCKCTVRLEEPENSIGRLLPDGTLECDAARLDYWSRGWETGDAATLACPAARSLGQGG